MTEGRDESEKAVLGCIILSPARVMAECQGYGIDEGWFTGRQNATIFRTIQEFVSDPQRLDLFTIGQKLIANNNGEGRELSTYCETLVNAVPTDAHSRYYLDALRGHWLRSRLRQIASAIDDHAANAEQDPDETLAIIQRDLSKLCPPEAKRSIPQVYDDIMARWKGGDGDAQGVPSRFRKLSEYMGRYRRGKVYVVAALRGDGKSTFMCNEALDMAKRKYRVSIASIEMSEDELRGKMVCEDADVSAFTMDTGAGAEHNFAAIGRVMPVHKTLPLRIYDDSLTAERFAAWATSEVVTHKADFLMLDYLQIMSTSTKGRHESRAVEISAMMRTLRETVKRLDVPMIVLSQLNRDNEKEKRRPRLSDLRESGSIEQDAYGVIFLHRDEPKSENMVFMLEKNRGGPKGIAPVVFEENRQRFSDVKSQNTGRNHEQ